MADAVGRLLSVAFVSLDNSSLEPAECYQIGNRITDFTQSSFDLWLCRGSFQTPYPDIRKLVLAVSKVILNTHI